MYAVSITIDNVIDALAAFIKPLVNDAPTIRAQVNRVPMPAGGFVLMTELNTSVLSVQRTVYDGDNDLAAHTSPKRVDVQLDFYGPAAGDWCNAVSGMVRTEYATSQFPDGIKPLYCNDALQAPMINGEDQYNSRWILTVSMQYNPVIEVPQQFADVVAVDTIEAVDVVYPY
jgi:hypothetical protein